MIKKIMTLAFIITFGSQSLQLNAQDSISLIFKTNPLRPIWGQVPFTGEYSFGIEKILDKRLSYQVSISIVSESVFLDVKQLTRSLGGPEITTIGGRVKPSVRFYFQDKKFAPFGFYWGPMGSVNYVNFSNRGFSGDRLSALYSSINIVIGYQFQVFRKLFVDIFTGIGYKYNSWRRPYGNSSAFLLPENEKGIKLTLGFEIGIGKK